MLDRTEVDFGTARTGGAIVGRTSGSGIGQVGVRTPSQTGGRRSFGEQIIVGKSTSRAVAIDFNVVVVGEVKILREDCVELARTFGQA